MLIRAATFEDIPQMVRVNVDTWRTAYRDILPASLLDGLSYEVREQRWRDSFAQAGPGQFTLVAEDAGGGGAASVVGFARGGPERDGTPGYDGEIYAIYVLAEQQHRGTGRQLMAACARHLAAEGFRAAMLWTLEENQRARAFYEALGGQLIGRKATVIGGTPFMEVAYGWPNLNALAAEKSS